MRIPSMDGTFAVVVGYGLELDEVVGFAFDHHERALSDLPATSFLAQFIDSTFRGRGQRVAPDI